MSNFQTDLNNEKIISSFFDTKVYSKLLKLGQIENFRRFDFDSEMDTQYAGIDISFSSRPYNLNQILIDEKAMSSYLLSPLPTFALELSYLNPSQSLKTGWFLDKEKKTQYYFCQWVKAKTNILHNLNEIEDVKFCLVEKKKLVEYLSSYGYTLDFLTKRAAEIRQSGQSGQHDKDASKPFWFHYNMRLKEQPINLVLKDEIYFRLATFKYIGNRYFKNDFYRLTN